MLNEKYRTHAEAAYHCDVYNFIGTGEGRTLSPREVTHLKLKYRYFDEWYATLDHAGRQRIDKYLANVSIDTWQQTVNQILSRDYSNDNPAD